MPTDTEREQRAPYDFNTATLPAESVSLEGARVRANEKRERIGTLTVLAYDGTFMRPVLARFYMGRSAAASVVYCSLWVSTRAGDRYFGGTGSAGGYGYDKVSAAFQAAVTFDAIRANTAPLESDRRRYAIGARAIIWRDRAWRVVCATCDGGGTVAHRTRESASAAATRDSAKPCPVGCGAR